MRRTVLLVAAGLTLVAACAKKPAAAPANAAAPPAGQPAAPPTATAGAPVSGVFTGDGRSAILTQVTAHPDDPFDGQPVTAIVLTAKDQGGDPKAAMGALFGNYGEAIVARIGADGKLVGTDVVHPGLGTGSTSLSGVITLEDYSSANGQLSGRLTTSGDQDVFGHKLNVDLTFHTKAP